MRPNEKIPRHDYQDASDNHNTRDPQGQPRQKSKSRFIPVMVFALFALIILSQEVPQVQDAIDSVISPHEFNARKSCEAAALKLATRPDFARIINGGDVVKTQNGMLVKNIVMGEMDEQGQEKKVPFHCYLDASGNIVSSGKTQE
ncbi:MAG TPA: hypothetical protein DDW55_10580 [Gammaproteobacteria bacterium]|nr:hypothetical protein [Gammaproteobacteria bacterium]